MIVFKTRAFTKDQTGLIDHWFNSYVGSDSKTSECKVVGYVTVGDLIVITICYRKYD